MNRDDINAIEHRLGINLPSAYCQALLSGVNVRGSDPFPYLLQDPKELLIHNLELRMCPVENAFCRAPWPEHFICIGFDGCGNYYSISAADLNCSVCFFDHEADEFTAISDSLDGYLHYLSELFARVERNPTFTDEATETPKVTFALSPDAVVTRTDKVRESVLDPISIQEWVAFVEADSDLQMREFRSSINPFTKEESRYACRGMAVMNSETKATEFEYAFGRIIVRRPGEAALAKLGQAARALNAKLITGW